MSKANFNHLIQSDKPVLIDFSAEWCGPCKMLKPILQEVKSRIGDKATIVKVDVDKNPALANQFEIRGVPTLMIFKNGKSEWRQSGVIQTDKLVSILQRHGAV